jgi:hypothetical protein
MLHLSVDGTVCSLHGMFHSSCAVHAGTMQVWSQEVQAALNNSLQVDPMERFVMVRGPRWMFLHNAARSMLRALARAVPLSMRLYVCMGMCAWVCVRGYVCMGVRHRARVCFSVART